MKEFLEQAFLSYNLPLTIGVCLVFLFWCINLLGVLDIDSLDVDFDTDTEVDVANSSTLLQSVLRFINADAIPTTVILSLLVLFLWGFSMMLNYYFNADQKDAIALGFFAGSFIGSVFVVKYLTKPLRPFIQSLREDEVEEPILNSIGSVRSKSIGSGIGQVRVKRTDGTVALINVKTRTGSKVLAKGDKVVIYEKLDEHTYLVCEADEIQMENDFKKE